MAHAGNPSHGDALPMEGKPLDPRKVLQAYGGDGENDGKPSHGGHGSTGFSMLLDMKLMRRLLLDVVMVMVVTKALFRTMKLISDHGVHGGDQGKDHGSDYGHVRENISSMDVEVLDRAANHRADLVVGYQYQSDDHDESDMEVAGRDACATVKCDACATVHGPADIKGDCIIDDHAIFPVLMWKLILQ
ncbi:hypothetical protein AMTR_s00005p00268750 [Amborella trichopoda]|uniref:Uncharacterized protein n=1 Tax=Amborella trichopoda TaxID=13333 RepID=W1PG77_AMBTC|nr:hypothetical protein AMTR_s00005p00268750 [Amborella trichopoda]